MFHRPRLFATLLSMLVGVSTDAMEKSMLDASSDFNDKLNRHRNHGRRRKFFKSLAQRFQMHKGGAVFPSTRHYQKPAYVAPASPKINGVRHTWFRGKLVPRTSILKGAR